MGKQLRITVISRRFMKIFGVESKIFSQIPIYWLVVSSFPFFILFAFIISEKDTF